MNELINRIVVALIGIPIGIYVIWYGSWLFFLAVLIISSLALYEFNSMVKLKELKPFFWINLITLISVLIFTFYVMMIDFSSIRYYLVTKSASILLSYFILYFIIIFISTLFSRRQNPILSFSVTIGTLFYVLLPFVSLIILRLYNFGSINYKNSWQLILSYFFTIWICDTFAYFVGKKWGNHKIAPAISPKKSWEGGIAGLMGAIISFIAFSNLFYLDIGLVNSLFLGTIIGIFGQIGDFLESSFKRDVQLKDSSKLLGQHGGILDRFDSIISTAPIVLLYIINL